jgi:hypothetical protein
MYVQYSFDVNFLAGASSFNVFVRFVGNIDCKVLCVRTCIGLNWLRVEPSNELLRTQW